MVDPMIHILHLEDEPADAELVQAILAEDGLSCRITNAQTRQEFEDILRQDGIEIILADYKLPSYDGMSALQMAHNHFSDIPFVFVSGTMGEEVAIEALTMGATDYVLKHNLSRLPSAVKRALQEAQNRRERRQAQEALQRSNEMLRASETKYIDLYDNAPDMYMSVNAQNALIEKCNQTLSDTLGYPMAEIIDRPVVEIYHPDCHDQVKEALQEFKEKGEIHDRELQLLKQDGSMLDVSLNATAVRADDGTILFSRSTLHDITERKQVERERLTNLNFFANMDRVNRAIQGTDDLQKMMKDLLDIVLSIFECDRAFLMYPCDPESKTWSTPMECSRPEYPAIRELRGKISMDREIAETLRILLATEGPVLFGPGTPYTLPEAVSAQFDIKSNMSMAIYPKTGSPWQFGIHQCSHTRLWTADEQRMFEAIGRRLADGLTSLLSYRDLCKSEEFLNSVVEHIPNMLFVKDAETLKFVRFNKAGEQLMGYSRDELLGKTDYDFFPKEDADFFATKDRQILESRELHDIPEETILTRNNEEHILHTKKLPILDENGVPLYLLGISEDITEQKQSEDFIRKLSQAVEQSPVSIIITDLKGKIEFVNAKFTQVTGYTFSEAMGQVPKILQSGETPVEQYNQLWQTIKSGGIWRGEFHNRKKNGELFWEKATIAPVRNADNAITHYVAVKEDITEQKILKDQLHQSQKMEAVGQLAGGVAHDFNNMLGVIIGRAELALEEEALDESLRQNLDQILSAGLRSADVTRKLLAFARKQTIAPKILDLNDTVEGMLKLLRRLIGEEVELSWQPGPKLWPVKMDPGQIDQILANLSVNSRDAIGGVGKIILQTQNIELDEPFCLKQGELSPGKYLMLAVSDDGCGMDKPTINRIFEPFFTTKGVGKGTGLGLATVYGIVKQNNGFITVHSEPGKGTTFKIYLPRCEDMDGKELEERLAHPILTGTETILVAEDEISHLMTVKLSLEAYGYRVLAASAPGEALRLAQEYMGDIHLLLTDLIMPEMNGKDLAMKMKTLYPNILCLFMSGYTSDFIVHSGELEKGVHFMEKPFSKQALATKVRELLERK